MIAPAQTCVPAIPGDQFMVGSLLGQAAAGEDQDKAQCFFPCFDDFCTASARPLNERFPVAFFHKKENRSLPALSGEQR
jgi:hypothetical protein